MIHSLSGGVIADNGIYTFAKVKMEQGVWWYLAEEGVSVGERVLVPKGRGKTEGEVVKVERCNAQCAPVPMNRIQPLQRLCGQEIFSEDGGKTVDNNEETW